MRIERMHPEQTDITAADGLSCRNKGGVLSVSGAGHASSTTGSTETPASSSMPSAVVSGVPGCTVCSGRTLRQSRRSLPCAQRKPRKHNSA